MPYQVRTNYSSSLVDLKNDQSPRVVELQEGLGLKRRLLALGVVKDGGIALGFKALIGDPEIYPILGYRMAVRNGDAWGILVSRV